MSKPEVKFEIDEHGRIGYRVTNEGVLLSKDEKEFIIDHVTRMQAENAKLREQMERLVTLLRVDCDIEASWDGLRKFWSIELTEGGCLMRDRACKAEAENVKLRELVGELMPTARIAAQHGINVGKLADQERRARELRVEVDG